MDAVSRLITDACVVGNGMEFPIPLLTTRAPYFQNRLHTRSVARVRGTL